MGGRYWNQAGFDGWQTRTRKPRPYLVCPNYKTCSGWVHSDRKNECCETCGIPYAPKDDHPPPPSAHEVLAELPDEVELCVKSLEESGLLLTLCKYLRDAAAAAKRPAPEPAGKPAWLQARERLDRAQQQVRKLENQQNRVVQDIQTCKEKFHKCTKEFQELQTNLQVAYQERTLAQEERCKLAVPPEDVLDPILPGQCQSQEDEAKETEKTNEGKGVASASKPDKPEAQKAEMDIEREIALLKRNLEDLEGQRSKKIKTDIGDKQRDKKKKDRSSSRRRRRSRSSGSRSRSPAPNLGASTAAQDEVTAAAQKEVTEAAKAAEEAADAIKNRQQQSG